MVAITPETLVRHELVGLRVRVAAADNPDLAGVEGRVVDETTNTLRVEGDGRVRTVPKAGATFEFELPDASRGPSDADSDGAYVTVEGARLVARPARRTEVEGGSRWRSA